MINCTDSFKMLKILVTRHKFVSFIRYNHEQLWAYLKFNADHKCVIYLHLFNFKLKFSISLVFNLLSLNKRTQEILRLDNL